MKQLDINTFPDFSDEEISRWILMEEAVSVVACEALPESPSEPNDIPAPEIAGSGESDGAGAALEAEGLPVDGADSARPVAVPAPGA